jgi:hypothetical protein
MERRRKTGQTPAPGGVAGAMAASRLSHIAALMEAGGQVMLGSLKPISGAAVAHDGKKTLAMLRRQPAELVEDLLLRLDAAIATAQSTGSRVDEINKPHADVRYEL